MLGYRTATQAARVGATDIQFALEHSAIEIDEIVVTGTAGATQKRAVGNVVSQIRVENVARIAPAANLTQLMNARSPGVVLRPPSGLAGAGSRILIRGRGSISLQSDPLVYVDGVRVNNRAPTAGTGTNSSSRLDDFNMEDIERIEIIKGPAAATLYGTEASNGVIQIITKRGRSGDARINLTLRQGAAWFMDPEGRWPVNYLREPTGVVEFNLAQVETDAGRPLFRTGQLQGYAANISGGTDALQYYVGADYDRDEGALRNNKAERFGGRANVTIAPNAKFDINTQVGVVLNRVDFGDGGVIFDAVLSRPATRATPSRGFFSAPSEVWERSRFIDQNTNRVTGGTEIRHRPLSWFNHHLRVGLDLSNEDNITLVPRLSPDDARFYSAATAAGSRVTVQNNLLTTTLDYSATATAPLFTGLTASTTAGTQYYRSVLRFLRAQGLEFPSPGVVAIQGAARTFGSDDETENVTVGVFVQEQLSWKDRLFLTAALRADDNSAFGESFDLVTYPKFSASWVVNEEPFWNVPYVDAFRLRAAYGHSGQQPTAFAALRTFEPVTGQAGAPAITPQFVGNDDLGPEKAREIELGFEAGIFGQRVGIDFTYYHETTEDAIVLRDVAPSSGFFRQQFVNLAEVKNSGVELMLNSRLLQTSKFSWDVGVNLSTNSNEVVELGLEDTPFLEYGIARNRHQPGYPVNAFFARRIVSADRGADGRPINILCDGGPGAAPMACANAPRLFVGGPEPTSEGAVSSTLTLFGRLSLFGLVDFKRGHRTWSSSLWCPGILGCEDEIYPERFDPVYAASSVLGITDDARWAMDLSFVKLREISLSYQLPERLVRGFGVRGASISVAGRNLHTWTDFKGLDPENVNSFGLSGLTFEQNELPQLAQFVTKINLSF
jgi:TonB-dependent SusC/RagA subfamily outer membrane receptor